MRRAEKAGREAATEAAKVEVERVTSVQRLIHGHTEGAKERAIHDLKVFARRLDDGSCDLPSDDLINTLPIAEAKAYLGAHNTTGRAWKAALEAYDRGFKARLAEEIKALEAQ
jgi:hypothetical protein